MANVSNQHETGFTMVEIVVVIVMFSMGIFTMGLFIGTVQGTQRNGQYLDIATNAAKDEVEQLRNSNYALLVAGQTIDFTSSLPNTLPAGKTGTAIISDPSLSNLKRVDITINYTVGSDARTVKLSALLGESGLTK
jgi:type II secretory pathway pseudopilin PulG